MAAKKKAKKKHIPLDVLMKRRDKLNKVIASRGGGDMRKSGY